MTQRHITIVGAGQSGLQLGIGLLETGFNVTMVSNRTPQEIYDGKVSSSQCIFHDALEHERSLDLDFWTDAPAVDGISFTVPHPDFPGEKAISWASRLDAPAKSIDQRGKFPRFMEAFVDRGGELIFRTPGWRTLSGMPGIRIWSLSRQVKAKSPSYSCGMPSEAPTMHPSGRWP